MIWESTILMVLFDVAIVGITVSTIVVILRHRAELRAADVTVETGVGLVGLVAIGMLYLVDLFVMTVLPGLTSPARAMAAMQQLHLHWAWIVMVAATACIGSGLSLGSRKVFLLVRRLQDSEASILRELEGRREAEAALRRREAETRAVVDAVPDLIFRMTADGTLREFIPGRGLPGHAIAAAIPGTALQAVVPEDVATAVRAAATRAHATGGVETVEYDLSIDDDVRHYEARVVAAAPDDVVGVVREVTGARRALEALRVSEERWRGLAENLPDHLMTVAPDGTMLYINHTVPDLTRDQVIGTDIVQWVPEASRPGIRDAIRRCVDARQSGRFETDYVGADGQVRIFEARYWPVIRDGRVEAVSLLASDVTEWRRADRALRDSEQRLRLALDAARMGTFDWDVASGRIACSGHVGDILGAGDGPIELTFEGVLDRTPPADRPAIERAFAALQRGAPMWDVEHRILRPDGGTRWVAVRGLVTRDDAGHPSRVLGTVMDRTEQKLADAALQQTQKLESLGVLAGGIAHDFNNLLVGILGNAGLAMMDMPANAPARERVGQVETAAKRAAELTKQLLAYSGRGRFVIEPTDLNPLVTEMTSLVDTAVSKSATVTFDLDPAIPTVEVDPTQIRQVILNLITNAAEAVGSEGGTVTVTTGTRDADPAQLVDAYLADGFGRGRYVFLEVADTGVGMDDATLSRMFDPFFTTKFTGRGLGMAAALGIVRGHRGGVQVRSAPGRGTTITVLLPPSASPAPVPIPPAPASEWSATDTILIIDDEEAVRAVSRASLEKLGLQILTAADGHEGLAIFRTHQGTIGAVLLDLTMPELDGEATLAAIRELDPQAAVILMSGYDEEDVSNRLDGARWDGFLAKPFSPTALSEKVREVLTGGPRSSVSRDAEG